MVIRDTKGGVRDHAAQLCIHLGVCYNPCLNICWPAGQSISVVAWVELGGVGAAHWRVMLCSSHLGVLLRFCTAGPCVGSRVPYQHTTAAETATGAPCGAGLLG